MKIEYEKTLEKKLCKEIHDRGGMCIKMAIVNIIGFPDRLCLMQGAKVVFAEIKTTGRVPSITQKLVHKRLRNLGFRVDIIDSSAKIKKLITDHE